MRNESVNSLGGDNMLKGKSLIVILLSLILLVACQAPNANPSSGSSSESNRGKKELTVWHIESQGGEPGLKDAVKRFEDKHPGVSVKLIKQENDPYKSKLVVAMGGQPAGCVPFVGRRMA